MCGRLVSALPCLSSAWLAGASTGPSAVLAGWLLLLGIGFFGEGCRFGACWVARRSSWRQLMTRVSCERCGSRCRWVYRLTHSFARFVNPATMLQPCHCVSLEHFRLLWVAWGELGGQARGRVDYLRRSFLTPLSFFSPRLAGFPWSKFNPTPCSPPALALPVVDPFPPAFSLR